MRGTQFSEAYDELRPRREAFERAFPRGDVYAFGISGDRTQHLLHRVRSGELEFRHPPRVVVLTVGTNNVGRDNDEANDIFLGVRAVIGEVLARLPGAKILLPGILPRGPPPGMRTQMPPAPGEDSAYHANSDAPETSKGAGKKKFDKYVQPGAHTHAIQHVNRRLAALAEGSGGLVRYVDCAHCFLNEDGTRLRPELMRDALHPTAAGMRSWLNTLVPAIEKLKSRELEPVTQSSNSTTLPNTRFNHGSLDTIAEQSRSLVEHLVSWTPHALCVSHVDGTGDAPIVYCNDNFVLQTGYAVEEVLGRDCRFLQGNERADPQAIETIHMAVKGGKACRVRLMNFHKDGTPLINNLELIPLMNSQGKAMHYMGIQRFTRAPEESDMVVAQSSTLPGPKAKL